MTYYLFAFLTSILVGLAVAPLIIYASKKFKISQTILNYVEAHQGKSGTPTMGGLIFIFASMTSFCFFTKNFSLAVISFASMLSFGILGFLDDFIKIKFKQNLGLKPYQKIIGQVGIATILAFFAYYSNLVGSTIFVPFTNITFDLAWGVIPFIVIVYLALTNAVNLTDGLDGLASGVVSAYLLGFIALLVVYQSRISNQILSMEYENLIILSFCVLGSLLAFMCFNIFPAKIFMGDTGSLSLGGFLASIAIFTRLELIVPIIGIMFVLSALSVIIQVLHFKRTKKRILLMAPLHHHFEKKGLHENKITFVYILVTLSVCALTVMITLYAGG